MIPPCATTLEASMLAVTSTAIGWGNRWLMAVARRWVRAGIAAERTLGPWLRQVACPARIPVVERSVRPRGGQDVAEDLHELRRPLRRERSVRCTFEHH